MDWQTFLAHIESDGLLLESAARAGLDDRVPCCPGWTVRDVVGHTGIVHRHKTLIVRGRLLENPAPPDLPDTDLIGWYRTGLEELMSALRNSDPAERVFTWFPPDRSIGFWYRRMAHETLIHRVDAEQGHGEVSSIDSELAADGIDEVLTMYVGGYPAWGTFEPGTAVARIECLDENAAWDIRFGRFTGTSPTSGLAHDLEAFVVIDRQADPAVTIRGTAAEINLWLWGRGKMDHLEVTGERELATGLRRICKESMG
jgi:uncharacterized protein (TIGR03083 family)